MKLELEIKDIDRDEIVQAAADRVVGLLHHVAYDEDDNEYSSIGREADKLRAAADAVLRERAEEAMRERIEAVAEQRIAEAVDAVIANGWPITDRYGNSRGERVDLAGRISEMLTEMQGDHYDRNRKTRLDKIISARVDEVFTKELKNEIETARQKLRAQLDAIVSGKAAEAIKSALGLG